MRAGRARFAETGTPRAWRAATGRTGIPLVWSRRVEAPVGWLKPGTRPEHVTSMSCDDNVKKSFAKREPPELFFSRTSIGDGGSFSFLFAMLSAGHASKLLTKPKEVGLGPGLPR